MKVILKIFIVSLSAFFAQQTPVFAQSKIAKCQDEDGKWHYGSANLHRCSDSKSITTFNERGVRIDETKRIKTEEELAAEKAQRDKEAIELEEKRQAKLERDRILTVYQDEQDIENARQQKMIGIDRKIGQHKNYIVALTKQEESFEKKKADTSNRVLKKKFQAKIDEIPPKKQSSEERITLLKQEKLTWNKKYDEDLAFFRKHKDN